MMRTVIWETSVKDRLLKGDEAEVNTMAEVKG